MDCQDELRGQDSTHSLALDGTLEHINSCYRNKMSFQCFVKDLCDKPLTLSRLEEVWKYCNFSDKSALIDPLTAVLHKFIVDKAKASNTEPSLMSIPTSTVSGLCEKFYHIHILKSIKPQEPLLKDLPNTVYDGSNDKYNPETGIVFKRDEKNSRWVAHKVIVSNRPYPLQLKHLSICVSNGWFYETNIDNINCPFKV